MKAILLLSLLVATGCQTLAPPAVHKQAVRSFNDRKINAHLVKEMSALLEAGKLADSDSLEAQLERERFSLAISAKPAPKALTPAEIYARCQAGVIIVANLYKCGKCDRWHTNAATGFIIDPDGVAVTNYHVIKNERENMLGAMTIDGRVIAISEVLAADKAADIAIIRLAGSDFTALPLAKHDPVGTPVAVISHPTQRYYTLSSGMISRYYQVKGADRMAITADFAKGSSGGPVINPYGEVTGVVTSTSSIYYSKKDGVDQNLQMVVKSCIPAHSVRKLLSE